MAVAQTGMVPAHLFHGKATGELITQAFPPTDARVIRLIVAYCCFYDISLEKLFEDAFYAVFANRKMKVVGGEDFAYLVMRLGFCHIQLKEGLPTAAKGAEELSIVRTMIFHSYPNNPALSALT